MAQAGTACTHRRYLSSRNDDIESARARGAQGVPLPLHLQLQWAHGSASPLFEGLPSRARIEFVLLSYTDAALFGLLVQAPTIEEVHVRGRSQSMCSKGAAGSLKAEELKKVVRNAIFESANALEPREGLVSTAISQYAMYLRVLSL